MKQSRRLKPFFFCITGVVVSMAVLMSLIITPLAEGTTSDSAATSVSGSTGVTTSTQSAATDSQASSASQATSSQSVSSEASSGQAASSSGVSSVSGSSAGSATASSSSVSSSAASSASSSNASSAAVKPQMTLAASPVPMAGLTSTAPITADSIVKDMEIVNDGNNVINADNFSVFANMFHQTGDMEGNIAVKEYSGISNIGNSNNVYNCLKTFNLEISIAAGTLNAGKNYTIGIFKDSAATGTPVKTVSITTDSAGNGSQVVTLSNGDTQVYYAFLYDSSLQKYITDSSQGITGGGSFCATNNDNYIQIMDKANDEFIRNCGFPLSTTFGNKYYLQSENGSITNAVIGDGSYGLYDKDTKAKVVSKVGGGGTNNTVKIATGTFPIDFNAAFSKMQTLSNKLANASSTYDTTLKVVNLSLNNSTSLEQALATYLGSSTAADSTGFSLGDNQYLIVNVDCGSNGTVTIPSYKINSQRGAWSPIASRVLWNFYNSKNSANGHAFTGNIDFSPNDAETFMGTILAPHATVTMGETVCGAVYADTLVNGTPYTDGQGNIYYSSHEVHKMTFGKASANVNFTVPYSLKVTKQWSDSGYENKRPTSITVQLYRDDGSGNSKYRDAVQLSGNNDWSYTYYGLPSSGTYTVVEEVTPSGYDSQVGKITHNTTDVDTILIKNTYSPPPYTLPSTGGPGTILFTVIGGATTLSAIALLLLYRRRRAERRTG